MIKHVCLFEVGRSSCALSPSNQPDSASNTISQSRLCRQPSLSPPPPALHPVTRFCSPESTPGPIHLLLLLHQCLDSTGGLHHLPICYIITMESLLVAVRVFSSSFLLVCFKVSITDWISIFTLKAEVTRGRDDCSFRWWSLWLSSWLPANANELWFQGFFCSYDLKKCRQRKPQWCRSISSLSSIINDDTREFRV